MTQDAQGRHRLFPNEFDDAFAVGTEPGNNAFFGSNVLQGLVDGIDDFINESQQRWSRPYESLAPALLGSAMWIDDPPLLDKIGELEAACVVVTKQDPKRDDYFKKLKPLAELNQRSPGMPVQAFPMLSYLAPRKNGKPAVLGPSSRMYDGSIPTIRTLGFRGGDARGMAPIIHAKLVLLGSLWWHDEHPLGYSYEITGFDPKRLWISSANFTKSSRRSLEFGYWTEDRALVEGAERFLVSLIGSSEPLDPISERSASTRGRRQPRTPFTAACCPEVQAARIIERFATRVARPDDGPMCATGRMRLSLSAPPDWHGPRALLADATASLRPRSPRLPSAPPRPRASPLLVLRVPPSFGLRDARRDRPRLAGHLRWIWTR